MTVSLAALHFVAIAGVAVTVLADLAQAMIGRDRILHGAVAAAAFA